jgi:NADPH:quinone reductase-like Zn-dependent oxidoreductase
MKAIVQDRYGSPDNLKFDEVDQPTPADNEVLVRVHAAAVNALDWHVMRGDPYLARMSIGFGGPKAKIRGRDFAGVVEAVGRNVSRLRPGDEVFGEADGAFAEYVCARDTMVDAKPANLTFEQAAAVPLAGNTALMGVRDQARVQPGQRILINGASGGVGLYAVQIAKALGAEVTGVCSTRNVELVRSLGADHVVDYTSEDFARNGHLYDVVFDLAGNRTLRDLRRALTPAGALVLSGGGESKGGALIGPVGLIIKGSAASRFVRGQRIVILQAKQSPANLATLRELVESGKVTPVIDRTYPLAQAADAIRYLEVEHARAKVVVTI